MTKLLPIICVIGYLFLGIFIIALIKKLSDDSVFDADAIDVFAVICWPVLIAFFIVVGLIYIPIKLATLLSDIINKRKDT